MSKVLYYLFLLPLSKLPMSVLYGFSNFLYLVIYKLVGYRKKVVYGNMQRSFPDKSAAEIDQIAKGFYRFFCDLLVENIRLFSMPLEEWKARGVVKNPELLDQYFEQNRPVIVFEGHYGNWEISGAGLPMYTKFLVSGLFAPLKDKFFERIMNDSRCKSGLEVFPKQEVRNYFEKNKNTSVAVLFGGDQSPTSSKKSFWMDFLNQDTSIAFGTEKYAIQYNCPVLFADVQVVKRGYYEMTFKLVTDKPREEEHGFITRTNMQLLEQRIIESPQYWLWSHKRWKRKREQTQ